LADFSKLVGWMDSEMEGRGVAHTEVLVSCLKILLIKATRLKVQQQSSKGGTKAGRPDVLRKLREMLETGYQREHRPSEYARMVGVSSRTLANLVKRHFHKTPSELIRDRVMRHAKWQLLHTLKPVKEVAFEVGFDDEFYFSRLFKRSFGCSPLFFREHETALRGGSNLSM
jgi:AraC family transcriptional activator of pobA